MATSKDVMVSFDTKMLSRLDAYRATLRPRVDRSPLIMEAVRRLLDTAETSEYTPTPSKKEKSPIGAAAKALRARRH